MTDITWALAMQRAWAAAERSAGSVAWVEIATELRLAGHPELSAVPVTGLRQAPIVEAAVSGTDHVHAIKPGS